MNWILPIIFIIFHSLNAVSNASKDWSWIYTLKNDSENNYEKNIKYWGKIFHLSQITSFVWFLVWISCLMEGQLLAINLPFSFINVIAIIGVFFLSRSMFDYVHNIVRGLELSHRGSGNIEDKILKYLKLKESVIFIFRVLALALSFLLSYYI